jgi:hypothetical protein
MTDGIYNDITIGQYFENKTHLSSTQVRTAKKSLKEFEWNRRGLIEQGTKSYFDFGNAFELALMSNVEFSQNVAIIKDAEWVAEAMQSNKELSKPRSSKVYQTKEAEFLKENAGKYLVKDRGHESFETIQAMLESCYADKAIQGLIKNTEYQLTIFWTDPTTGLKLKTRPDICKRKKNVLVNIKTAEDGSPQAFSRELVKYDYPMQAAHEITGCLEMGAIESIDNYFWLVVEKKPPFNATIYEFTQEDIRVCLDELHWTYEKIAKAEKQNLYPGYSDMADNEFGILRASIPMYYRLC